VRFRRRFRARRIALIIGAFVLFLVAVNQISLFVATCNDFRYAERQNKKENNSADYECSSKDGVIVQGIFLLPEVRPEWWIALFTLTLWISTDRLWRTSERHARHVEQSLIIAKASADATSRQADAFIAVESPTLVFSGFKIVERLDASGRAGGRDPITTVPMPEFLQALILPINIGRAPLRIIRICIEYDIGELLPEQPFYYSISGTNIVLRNLDPGTWLVPEANFNSIKHSEKILTIIESLCGFTVSCRTSDFWGKYGISALARDGIDIAAAWYKPAHKDIIITVKWNNARTARLARGKGF
jgi:hypothetical protein